MKITVELTAKELELLLLFKKNRTLSIYNNFEGWNDTKEFVQLLNNGLIYHSNPDSKGSYIRYALTQIGETAIKQNI